MFSEWNNQKRAQDAEMIDSFMDAAEKRVPVPTGDDVLQTITNRNSYRMWRLHRDLLWFKKELRRLGYNPEDWREFL